MSLHTHRRTPPAPKPTPRPSRVATPAATPGPLSAFADALTKFQKSFIGELTLPQRRFSSKIPDPEAVRTLGTRGELKVLGLANTVPPGAVAGAISGIGTALGILPGRRTRISAASINPEQSVRHEAAHQLLTAQGTPLEQQHAIIGRAVVPGTTVGVSPRLLEGVRLAETVGTEELRRKSARQIQQTAFSQRRQETKTGGRKSIAVPLQQRDASNRDLRTLLGMNL